jgi:hypothetical protein
MSPFFVMQGDKLGRACRSSTDGKAMFLVMPGDMEDDACRFAQ